jgi:carboxypeptidase family protein
MITPPPRTVLGTLCVGRVLGRSRIRSSFTFAGLIALGIVAGFACGDPNDPGTTGVLAGLVRDAETDTPIEGVTLVVAGIQVQTGSDGRFAIDSVPTGAQQVAATKSGYLGQTLEIQIRAGEIEEITVELVADLGPPGPSGVSATTDAAAPGTVRVSWEPVAGATGYVVYWGTHSPVNAEEGTRVADAPNPFIHTELSGGTTYYYVVTAIGPEGETRPSAEVSATPDGPISIRFVNPRPTQIVGARFSVTVEISSVFQLTSVTAQVGAFTDDLTYHPESDEWEGFFDLGDTPSPSFQTVHYTATDAAGNTAKTAVLLRFDRLPLVTLSPLDGALADPSLHVVATCTDDNPAGCASLTISVSDGGRTITKAVGTASVDQVISLAEFDGQVVDLRAGGADVVQDRIHRTPGVVRTVYVDASPGLTAVANAGSGTIIDANADDLVVVGGGDVNSSLPTDTLRLVDRASGQSTVIHSVLRERAREGFLFPGGAIFIAAGSVREWRNGASSVVGTEAFEGSLKVEGSFAIWSSSGGVLRRELTAGTNVTVVNGPTNADVAPSGEVAWNSGAPYEIFLFQGGMNVQFTDDGGGELGNTSPVTDGINVVYRRLPIPLAPPFSIRLSDAGGEITLSSGLDRAPDPGREYQVNDGWIAFVRPDLGNVRQIWRRSPTGVETQASAFGLSSTIESMGPDGEIVFTSDATGVTRRYRALVGASPTDISSGLGRSSYIDGQPHIMMGATLLRVD